MIHIVNVGSFIFCYDITNDGHLDSLQIQNFRLASNRLQTKEINNRS